MIYDIDDGHLAQQVPGDIDTVECCTCGALFFPGEISQDEGCLECGGRLFDDEL